MDAKTSRNAVNGRLPIGPVLALSLVALWSRSVLGDGHEGPPHGGVTSIDICPDGQSLHLLVASRSEAGPTELHYRHSEDGGESWGEPVRVGDGMPPPEGAHRGKDVQIAASGNRLIAVWETKGTGPYGGGPMATAISMDGGWTWRPGPNPADDGTTGRHGFIDIAADAEGTFHLVWLDSRNGAQGLRYARSADGGMSWSRNQTLDDETCECCWNTITTASGGGVAVLYRDKDPRDMGLVRSSDGGKTWTKPITVGKFDWDIEACPHVGGGLALVPHGSSLIVYATAWSGRSEVRGAYSLTSFNGGETWSEPKRLGDPRSWHSDLTAADGGELAAVWDARTDKGRAVFAATSQDRGRTWTEPRQLSAEGTSASHPRIISTPWGFRAFWTETADGKVTTWIGRGL